jgi:hypothetical protein
MAASTQALGHAFWILPASFRPQAGEPVGIQLRVGDELPGETVKRNDARITRFTAAGPGQSATNIPGMDGSDPAGFVRPEAPGVWVIAYENTPASVELSGEKFEAYLAEEGLDKVIARRTELGESALPAKELYSRCAKAILHAGGMPGPGFDRPAGMKLELTPLVDPATIKPGATLRVRLDFDGKPLAGVLVHAHTPATPTGPDSGARTDENGVAAITISTHGMWVLDAVEMVDAEPASGARWRSYWASLSFEVPAPPAGPE